MLVDGEGNKTRVGTRLEGEKKVRFSKVSGSVIPEKKS
jgi:large subunit ribosomal protein L24